MTAYIDVNTLITLGEPETVTEGTVRSAKKSLKQGLNEELKTERAEIFI